MKRTRRKSSTSSCEAFELRCLLSSVSLIEDLNTASEASTPQSFYEYNDRVYFAADTATHNNVLFTTDGTKEGTYPVATTAGEQLEARLSGFQPFTTFKGSLYAVAETRGGVGGDLWKLNDDSGMFEHAFAVPDASQIVVMNDELFVGSSDGLFRIDFENQQRSLITDTYVGQHIQIGSGVLFAGSSHETGTELFFTDGTQEGTRLVGDINPGSASSWPRNFYSAGETVYFTAQNEYREIWSTDGSSVNQVTDFSKQHLSPRVLDVNETSIVLYHSSGDLVVARSGHRCPHCDDCFARLWYRVQRD